jgi:hypothetical protein
MQSCCVANARDTTSHTVFVFPKVRSLGGRHIGKSAWETSVWRASPRRSNSEIAHRSFSEEQEARKTQRRKSWHFAKQRTKSLPR